MSVYHILNPIAWQAALTRGSYEPSAFKKEGFIHCSDLYQVEMVANFFYSKMEKADVLQIDPDKAGAPLVYENSNGEDMLFPHLYGILPVEAVEEVFSLERNPEGRWILPEHKRIPEMPMFSEIPYGTPGHAFRSRMPGSSMFDAGDEIFSKYLDNNVHTVIVLNPVEEIIKYSGGDLLARYHDAGLRVIHIPARDFNVPQIGAFDRGVELAARLLKEGKNIAIHCHAGVGRTGMFTACLAQDLLGIDADASIDWIREIIPHAVETGFQKQYVRAFKPHSAPAEPQE